MTEFRVGVTQVWTVLRDYKPINPLPLHQLHGAGVVPATGTQQKRVPESLMAFSAPPDLL